MIELKARTLPGGDRNNFTVETNVKAEGDLQQLLEEIASAVGDALVGVTEGKQEHHGAARAMAVLLHSYTLEAVDRGIARMKAAQEEDVQ